MECERARRVLSASLLLGAVSRETGRADRHADACELCAAFRETLYRRLAEEADAAPTLAPVPEGLEDRLLGAVRARRRFATIRFGLAALAFGAVAFGGIQAHHARSESARRHEETVRRTEAIERQIRQDRALLATDPMSGSPIVSFADMPRP